LETSATPIILGTWRAFYVRTMKVGPQGDHAEIYRALVAHAFELMTVVDEGGDIVFENGAIERVTGYQMEERVGRSLFDFVHPEDAGRMKEAFDRARAGRGTTPRLDLRTRHRDGRWLPVESIARFIGGDVVHGLVHSQDVSERNDLRLRLRLAQRLTTLGRLTLGLADDFAKVVATIRAHLRSFKRRRTSVRCQSGCARS
jgi:PAS domain S-box-containing protein